MILIVGMNPAWQKVCRVPGLKHGEVNRVTSMSVFGSGKGPNVARALLALGGVGEVIGYAGGPTGALEADYLRGEGLRCSFIPIEAETRTCVTYVEPDGTCTELIEPSPVITPVERERLTDAFARRIDAARVLVISGTAVAGEEEGCYVRFVRAAHERGIPVLLDSSSREARLALGEAPEVLKINAHELGEISGRPVESAEQRRAACRQLMAAHGIRWCMVSRGADGMEAYDGRTGFHAVPPPVRVVNAIGSGDSASAGTAWTIHERRATMKTEDIFATDGVLEEALRTATAMGTANCLTTVTGHVDPEALRGIRAQVQIHPLPA
jgi:tagatose 6-phosphate kinase